MRLRPLTEAECYARCYGGRHDDSVNVLRPDGDQGGPPGSSRDGVDGSLGGERESREAA